MQPVTDPGPARVSTPVAVPEPSRVSRVAGPSRAPKATTAEVGRAEFGLKVLYDCDDAEVEYATPLFPWIIFPFLILSLHSIITLHGLNGHRERTFTANNGVCWLDSLLPERLPKIRVISFGYDARTHSSSPLSQQHLHDHAEQLVENLTRRRNVTKVCGTQYEIAPGIVIY